jgi:hypothetical protein
MGVQKLQYGFWMYNVFYEREDTLKTCVLGIDYGVSDALCSILKRQRGGAAESLGLLDVLTVELIIPFLI